MNVIELVGVLYFLMCINCSLAEWATHPHNGMRYYFSAEAKDFNSASEMCKRNYGNLATVHTNLEHEFILRHLNQSADKKFWIGLQIDGSEDINEWIDGTKIGFSKLIYDKSLQGSCVAYEWDILLKKWKWKTSECFEDNHFICKLSSGPCPAVSISGAMLYKEMNGVYEFYHETCDCCEDQLRPVYKKPNNGLLLYFNVIHNGWCVTSTCVKNQAIRFSNSIYPYVISASMSYELSQSSQNWAPSFFVIKCLADYKARYDKLPSIKQTTIQSTQTVMPFSKTADNILGISPTKINDRSILHKTTPNPTLNNGIVMNDSRYRSSTKSGNVSIKPGNSSSVLPNSSISTTTNPVLHDTTSTISTTRASFTKDTSNENTFNITNNSSLINNQDIDISTVKPFTSSQTVISNSDKTSIMEDVNRTENSNLGQSMQDSNGANCVCGETEYLRILGLGFGYGVIFVVVIDIFILVIYICVSRRRRRNKKRQIERKCTNGQNGTEMKTYTKVDTDENKMPNGSMYL